MKKITTLTILAAASLLAMPALAQDKAPAAAPTVSAMLAHWEEALVAVGYLDPAAPKKLMPRLRLLFQRAAPTASEVHILRGVARAMIAAARGGRR